MPKLYHDVAFSDYNATDVPGKRTLRPILLGLHNVVDCGRQKWLNAKKFGIDHLFADCFA